MATRPMFDLGQKRASPAEAKEYTMHEEPRQRRLRILVVDGNHDGAMTLSTLLELNGYQTNTAHNGLDGVIAFFVQIDTTTRKNP